MSTAVAWSWGDVVNAITSEGQLSGLTQDQIDAALTVAKTENGYTGIVGDNGTSFGVFQLHQGGQLNSFAAWLGVGLSQAAQVALSEPLLVIQFALQDGGYLNSALKSGASSGNSGLNLALYAEQFGQGAQWTAAAIANVTANWLSLFSGKPTLAPPATVPLPPAGSATLPAMGQVTLPVYPKVDAGFLGIPGALTQVADAIGGVPGAITAAILSIERFFWIGIGLVIVALGIWIIGRGGN